MPEFYESTTRRLRRSRSVYERLLGELITEWRAERVPHEDFMRLTEPRPEKFWDGHATETTVLELRMYLEDLRGYDEMTAAPEATEVPA